MVNAVNDSNDAGPKSNDEAISDRVKPCMAAPDIVDEGIFLIIVGFNNGISISSSIKFFFRCCCGCCVVEDEVDDA